MKVFCAVILALATSASAFVPSHPRVMRSAVKVQGKYDDQLWDMKAKQDVYAAWDPSAPRTDMNFNPFEKNDDGNSCDTSGIYPGEGKYKDPMRPDTSFAIMQEEAKIMAEITANPKAGDVKGAPGRLACNNR